MSTGNHHTSERGSLGHEDVVFLEARRNKQVYKQCDKSSSKEEDICFEDMDIMKGLESALKKYDESSSDSDNIEYDFQDNQKQRKVTQMEEDFKMYKWRSLKSLKPQGMHLNDWLNIHFEKGFDVAENKQKNDTRALESKESAHRRLWKWRDDNGVMHPNEIEEVFRMDTKKSSIPQNRDNVKRSDSRKQRKRSL